MKFVEPRPFADPGIAARKLVEIANGIEAAQDGRIYIERVNAPFLAAGGSGQDFRAGMARAIAQGDVSDVHRQRRGAVCVNWLNADDIRLLGLRLAQVFS